MTLQAHFEENSFEQNRADGWKKLKPNAVPTVFSFRRKLLIPFFRVLVHRI